jgi:non-heme chloroperoxidase
MTLAVSAVALASGVTLSLAASSDASGPALVFLPGPTDSWRSYAPVLTHLPSSIRTIAVSQRGHGDSDKPPTGYRVDDFAADVPLLLDALGIERAVLVGHSGSCLVARRVALDHAERVAGLILEASPSTLRCNAGLVEFVEEVVAHLSDPIDPAFARSVVTGTSSDDLAPDIVDELVTELTKVPAHVWREMFAALLAYDDLDEIHRITAPTLLMWGDADALVDDDMQILLAKCISGAERRVYPGVGHTPRWELPERFAADIAAFVETRVQGP